MNVAGFVATYISRAFPLKALKRLLITFRGPFLSVDALILSQTVQILKLAIVSNLGKRPVGIKTCLNVGSAICQPL